VSEITVTIAVSPRGKPLLISPPSDNAALAVEAILRTITKINTFFIIILLP